MITTFEEVDNLPDSEISKSKEEIISKIDNRTEEWRKFVEKRIKEGETFEEAYERLHTRQMRKLAEQAGLSYPVKMPQYPESKRILPNSMLRSALFGAIGKGPRRFLRRELIASIDGIHIKYTGERLDQGDLEVYEAVLHHIDDEYVGLGLWNYITGYSLLKLIGKTDTGKNRDILHERIVRLCANSLELKQGDCTYIGSLIQEAFKSRKNKKWIIVLNPTLGLFFKPNQFTLTDWNIRRQLSGQSLAQWLYGFYATHADPYPMKIDTLLELSGSENINPRSSYQKLKKALNAVVEAFKAVGEEFSYEIKGNMVYVRKQPSKSQQRHLERKKRK